MLHVTGWALIVAAITVGVVHTLIPDHWLPIVLVARDKGWSVDKTVLAAVVAGTGHVGISVLLGLVALAVGAGLNSVVAVGKNLEIITGIVLVGFGLWYGLKSLRHGHHQHAEHAHAHQHPTGEEHTHIHEHHEEDMHPVLLDRAQSILHEHKHQNQGPIALLFILGLSPCVTAIPIFFAAAANKSLGLGFGLVTMAVFAAATLGTMMTASALGRAGVGRIGSMWLEEYGEGLTGLVIAVVGAALLVLGL